MSGEQAPLTGKVAVVTGAARGQGAAAARLLARRGCNVVLADVRSAEGCEVADEIGSAAAFRSLDIGAEEDWRDVVQFACERFGGVDILVNNAAIHASASLEDTSLGLYQQVVRVNQIGCFLGMRSVVGPMRARGSGSIVNISSVNSITGVPGAFAYAATKYAVRGMARAAALELGRYNIRVNSVFPGAVDTPMINAHSGEIDSLVKRLPIARLARPGEVAELVLFLASDASSYCTGSEFVIDGGMTAGPLESSTRS